MNNSIKLHLACGKDGFRLSMQHIKVTKQNCVATDSHILAVIPSELIFNSEFISDIPEEGFLIHAEDYKKMIQFEKATWKTKGEVIKMEHKKKRPILIEVVKESDAGKFVNWEAVTPKGLKTESKQEIRLNAELLYRLQQCLGSSQVRLTFYEGNKPIEVKPLAHTWGKYGIIMPCTSTP